MNMTLQDGDALHGLIIFGGGCGGLDGYNQTVLFLLCDALKPVNFLNMEIYRLCCAFFTAPISILSGIPIQGRTLETCLGSSFFRLVFQLFFLCYIDQIRDYLYLLLKYQENHCCNDLDLIS